MKKIILLLVIIFLLSCGARKSDVSKKEESIKTEASLKIDTSYKTEIKQQDETNIKKTSEIKTDDNSNTVVEENIFEPVDPTKPSSYTDHSGKNHVLNNAKRKTTKTTIHNDIKTASTENLEEFRKAELQYHNEQKAKLEATLTENKKQSEKAKKTDRDAWSLWWLLIPIGLIGIGCLAWKKYKDKIWWV